MTRWRRLSSGARINGARIACAFLAGATILLGVASPSQAAEGERHPYNETHAEVEYNPESGCLEVALRLDPLALEEALRRSAGQPVDLDHTTGVTALITEYLRERFQVREEGRLAPLHWIGKELEANEAWAYFELELESGPAGTRWENHVLFELDDEQRNTVIYTENSRVGRSLRPTRQVLVFDAEHLQHRLRPSRADGPTRLRRHVERRGRTLLAGLLERAAQRALESKDNTCAPSLRELAQLAARLTGNRVRYQSSVAPHFEDGIGVAARSVLGFARSLRPQD